MDQARRSDRQALALLLSQAQVGRTAPPVELRRAPIYPPPGALAASPGWLAGGGGGYLIVVRDTR